jgi:hypothetical protein
MIAPMLLAAGLVAPATAQDGPETALACTNAGNSYSVGEFACIAACYHPRRLARCDVVSERPTWTYVSETCPSAMLPDPPAVDDLSAIPATFAMSPIPARYSPMPAEMPVALAGYLD